MCFQLSWVGCSLGPILAGACSDGNIATGSFVFPGFNLFYQEKMHPFVQALVRALQEAGARSRRLPIQTRLVDLTSNQLAEDIATMRKVALELIQERKQKGVDGVEGNDDILGRMLAGTDPLTGQKLTEENVVYQMVSSSSRIKPIQNAWEAHNSHDAP